MNSIMIAFPCTFLACTFVWAEEIGTGDTVVTTTNAPVKTEKPRKIYEDEEFRIVTVDYGTKESPQTPGFYIFGKKHQKWVSVEKVSLRESILGRSPTIEECRAAGKNEPSITWDFKSLAKQDYVDFPLKGGGFLFFPDKIERNEKKNQIIFRFNSSWEIVGVETVLIVPLGDLRKALKNGSVQQDGGADQTAAAVDSKPEGKEKPKPVSEVRPR
jgi:hypothetical protein